jgi:hypothetical protein
MHSVVFSQRGLVFGSCVLLILRAPFFVPRDGFVVLLANVSHWLLCFFVITTPHAPCGSAMWELLDPQWSLFAGCTVLGFQGTADHMHDRLGISGTVGGTWPAWVLCTEGTF